MSLTTVSLLLPTSVYAQGHVANKQWSWDSDPFLSDSKAMLFPLYQGFSTLTLLIMNRIVLCGGLRPVHWRMFGSISDLPTRVQEHLPSQDNKKMSLDIAKCLLGGGCIIPLIENHCTISYYLFVRNHISNSLRNLENPFKDSLNKIDFLFLIWIKREKELFPFKSSVFLLPFLPCRRNVNKLHLLALPKRKNIPVILGWLLFLVVFP